MATTLRELLIKVGVDANNAKASLAQVDAGVNRVKQGFQNLATFAAAATGAIGAAGIGAVLLASQAAAAAKTIDLQSRALGLQVEQYQKLTQAAASFGLEQQDVAQAMVKTTLALQAGAEGGEAQAEAFSSRRRASASSERRCSSCKSTPVIQFQRPIGLPRFPKDNQADGGDGGNGNPHHHGGIPGRHPAPDAGEIVLEASIRRAPTRL